MQDYVGYRTKKRQEKQKKKKKALWWVLAVVAVLVIFVILGTVLGIYPFDVAWDKTSDGFVWLGRKIKSIWPWKSKEVLEAEQFIPEGKESVNYLIAITKQYAGLTQLNTVVLASYDAKEEVGSLIYFPSDLLISVVPGVGMDILANLVDLDEGRISMTLVAIENLMGVEIDRYVMGSDRDLAILFNKLNRNFEVKVDKKTKIEDKDLNVSFELEPGTHELGGRKLAAYLTYTETGKDMDRIWRQRDFVPGFLADFSGGDAFKSILPFADENANVFESDASNKEIAGIFQAYALLEGDSFQQGTIPVTEFKLEDTVVSRVDNEKLPAFVKKYVKSDYEIDVSKRYKIEILNGCGVPMIGDQVADRLNMDLYQVVNSGNADRFDHAETLVIVYNEDQDTLTAAEKIVSSLGVGRVIAQPGAQGVADITIVVGKDFASG